MVKLALWVRLEVKPGKEAEVEKFLRDGLQIVQGEPATTAWFAIRIGPSTFGIFDAFPDEAGRQAHLTGKVAAALKEKASDLFAKPPEIQKVDVLRPSSPFLMLMPKMEKSGKDVRWICTLPDEGTVPTAPHPRFGLRIGVPRDDSSIRWPPSGR